ncbi:low temperature requirement protein A [Micromonospora sp. 4G57]|uniref:Low temperature requirement protein A n=1 Tax=Micromonospora sicca TaxID=2202420 RepID=A0ABU5JJU2_9ACTN|nr:MULTISPECIES: low temperature requirement protein A [unclassified Micromonospora]MDZ5442788.1 low temperature requirement protein A [Micromonospora sp. 4G57]MDZ5492663.1 low temperature requirement protein A [Micromonospora sp. 4G53]
MTNGMRRAPRMRAMTEGATVTPLELFFDLVFVYALTQVTALMAADLTWRGVGRGMLVLALLWWCWCCYAWLGNTVRADEGVVRLALFAVMATMFVVAVTIPEAFVDLPGGLSGPVVFAACYLAVRVLHPVIYWHAARGDAGLRRQLLRAALPMLGGATLLFTAALLPQQLTDDPQRIGAGRTLLWVLALAIDYGGVMAIGAKGWQIYSAAHWTERHGLIIIIALGESLVAIGVGVTALPISWPIIVAAFLGITVAAALWWAYFDVVAIAAERVLHRAQGAERAALGRDSYTYLHLPMVAGIILLALGFKKVLAYVGDVTHHRLTDPLHGLGLLALYGGVILYLLGHLGFRLRNMGSVNWPRVAAMVLLVALLPVADHLPALAALGLLALVCAVMVAAEMVLFGEARRALRNAFLDEHGAGASPGG